MRVHGKRQILDVRTHFERKRRLSDQIESLREQLRPNELAIEVGHQSRFEEALPRDNVGEMSRFRRSPTIEAFAVEVKRYVSH